MVVARRGGGPCTRKGERYEVSTGRSVSFFLYFLMTFDPPPRVAIIGPPASGKAALAAALLTQHTGGATSTLAPPAPPDAPTPPPPTPWRLDTKYYTATVHVSRSAPVAGAAAGADAVVLTVANGAADAWTTLTAWADADAADVETAEIKVACVVCDGGGGVEEGEWIESARAWCAERAFELVPVALSDATADAALASENSGGIDRVADALIAHQWPGLTLKRAPVRNTPTTADADAASSPTDADLEAVDALMADLTATRARLARLPDAERRAGAADAAVRLAAALGLGEEGGSESE